MRTAPVIGHKAWFGPRRLGWGLGPVSVEGWVATLAFTALSLSSARWDRAPTWFKYLTLSTFLLLVFLKGTSPGGRRAREEFEAATSGG